MKMLQQFETSTVIFIGIFSPSTSWTANVIPIAQVSVDRQRLQLFEFTSTYTNLKYEIRMYKNFHE